MRIAMIGQKGIPATYGGVERHVEELSARLVARGHDVTAYCRAHYTPPGISGHRGVRIRRLPSIATEHLDTITHTALAAAEASSRQFDVVHFHAIGPALMSFLPRIFPFRRHGVVVTVHALDHLRRKWGPVARWWLRRGEWAATHFSHRTIVVSRRLEEHFARKGRRVAFIPNGVPPAEAASPAVLADIGLEPGRYVLWLGRFVPEKRVEDIIRAFGRVRSDHRLVLAGETDEGPYVRGLRRIAGGDRRVVFAGGLYGAAKVAALAYATLVVSASELEGFPIAVLEAMRYARPILVSDIPEHLEAIVPGKTGFVFPLGSVDALAERMDWVLSHPQESEAAGRQAAQAADAYDWDRVAERTEAVYEEVAAEAGIGAP